MLSVTLFQLENENIKVTIDAFIEDTGNLVVEGYDIGKTVKSYWGDSDYEYSVTVPAEEVKKLYPLFNIQSGDQMILLSSIRERFHSNTCYSEFRDFLDRNNIRSEGFSWT